MDKGGEQEGEGDMNGESGMDACTPTFVNRQPVGICCMSLGAQVWGWGREETRILLYFFFIIFSKLMHETIKKTDLKWCAQVEVTQ